jgi:hypothetical protein
MLPLAGDGLSELGMDREEIDMLLSVIEHRFSTRQTGSVWQLIKLNRYQEKYDKPSALSYLLQDYMALSESGAPVSTW